MNLDNYTPKGELEGFPKEVIAKMLEEQVKQGNDEDVTVFEVQKDKDASKGGIHWDDTSEDYDFWNAVIRKKQFDVFFAKYPKSSSAESKYPKVMMVSNDKIAWYRRVVFMEKQNNYLAWDDAETIEEAEFKLDSSAWRHAKDIEEIQPPTPKTLEERVEAIEKHLNLNQ